MLFDIRGKRRRVVQVVYGVLAVLFAVSFVGFGIGSDAAGGIFDALGVGGSNGSAGNPQYEEEIEQAEERLQQDPKDERALLTLARVHFLAGQAEMDADEETGAPVVTEDARTEFAQSVDSWERYLELEGGEPNPDAARLVVQAYVGLEDAEGAAHTQRIVAEDLPTVLNFFNLALYLYSDGKLDEGNEAAKRAVAEANPSQREQLRQQLDQIAKQAEKLKKAQEKLPEGGATGENPLASPLGGFGTEPTAPPAGTP